MSSRGYAFGYLGGGLLLAGNLALIRDAASLGLSSDGAVQLALLSGGLWWGGIALVTFAAEESCCSTPVADGRILISILSGELVVVWQALRRLARSLRYLPAYMA